MSNTNNPSAETSVPPQTPADQATPANMPHHGSQVSDMPPANRKRYKRRWGSDSTNAWRMPQLDASFWPVFFRNFLVSRKLAVPSLVGNIAEPLIWLVAFGYGMGALIGTIEVGSQTVPYLLFLASGSICMSAMNAASFEALYSAFSRMHVQKTWDGIMNAPISLDNIVLAEMLWASFKALFTATAIMGVMLALNISTSPKLIAAWPVLMLTGITFSCLALVFNALAKGYDFFTYYFTLFLTPMMFLSGVFFPLNQLPTWVADIANALPLANAVALVRPLFMDQWPDQAWWHLLVLLAYAVAAFWVALALTRKRFGM